MPLGIVNDNEWEEELNKLSIARVPVSFDNARVVTPLPLGRGEGNREVPEVLRKIIGESALENGNAETLENLAAPLGISASSISAYKKGATSTASYNEPQRALVDHTQIVRNRISRRASRKLNDALGMITTEKMQDAKLKDLSTLAKDMSTIMKNMEHNEDSSNNKPTNIIFVAPRVKHEEQYETITVNE